MYRSAYHERLEVLVMNPRLDPQVQLVLTRSYFTTSSTFVEWWSLDTYSSAVETAGRSRMLGPTRAVYTRGFDKYASSSFSSLPPCPTCISLNPVCLKKFDKLENETGHIDVNGSLAIRWSSAVSRKRVFVSYGARASLGRGSIYINKYKCAFYVLVSNKCFDFGQQWDEAW